MAGDTLFGVTPTSVGEKNIPRVLIVGGGYAGVRVAWKLRRAARRRVCGVTLLDKSDVHVNPAVLYEVATAFASGEREAVGQLLYDTASVPFRTIFGGTAVQVLQGTVERLDPVLRSVHLADGTRLDPHLLVVAVGSQLATFNIPGIEPHAYSIKSLHEAVEVRSHIVHQFLRYREASLDRQRRAFRVVIVGGGSAGVELAAECVLFLRKLAQLHGVRPDIPEVLLYEASDTFLRECSPYLRAKGLQRLRALGVHVHPRMSVCRIGQDHVTCDGERNMGTDTVVWLAGIRASDLLLRSGLPTHPRGGLLVEPTLEVKGFRNVFGAGDCVYAEDPQTKRVAPDVVYAALQQGSVVAMNVLRRFSGQPLLSYIDRPRPVYATVGGKYALVSIPPVQFAGRIGWVIKQLMDLGYLLSILPSRTALRVWLRSVRVRIAND